MFTPTLSPKEYKAKKQALLAEIDRVFANVTRDDDVLEAITRFPSHVISEEQKQLLSAATRWQDIPHDVIKDDRALLIYSNSSAFRFFLPAYLSYFMRHMDSRKENAYSRSSVFHSLRFGSG